MSSSASTATSTVFVADISILVEEGVSELVSTEGIPNGSEIMIPVPVVFEIENLARAGKEIGHVALEELSNLSELEKDGSIRLRFEGERPRGMPSRSDIDDAARDIAKREGATLLTSDKIQDSLARAFGIRTLLFSQGKRRSLSFENYFSDGKTMSLHFREGSRLFAKKGTPAKTELVFVGDTVLSSDEVNAVAREVIENVERNPDAFIELDFKGATIVQYEDYRITIARPPFSDGMEVTIIRPITKLSLSDYNLDPKLLERLEHHAEGIILAGSPGAGKTTFAQALAEFYYSKNKIVKTMESPRDLQVRKEITQYSPLEGDMVKTSEVLLLARPDYTIYDELRKTSDFEIFADMRLAGVGMIGVVHASRPIDAIQRFISRLELGVIPQVVDTVIFLKGGRIEKVFEQLMTVKVPTGMTESDLTRPVIEVRDFFTGKLEFDIFTFGEETTIMPVKSAGGGKARVFDERELSKTRSLVQREIVRLTRARDEDVKVSMESPTKAIAMLPDNIVPRLIGKRGSTITRLEKKLGVHIDVVPESGSEEY